MFTSGGRLERWLGMIDPPTQELTTSWIPSDQRKRRAVSISTICVAFWAWIAAGSGCTTSNSPPRIDVSALLAPVELQSPDGNPLEGPLRCNRGAELAYRINFRSDAPAFPTELAGRPVQSPAHWRMLMRCWPKGDNGDSAAATFLPVNHFHHPRGKFRGTSTITDDSGKVVSRGMSPPESIEPGRQYFAVQHPMHLPPGDYEYKLLLFPSADPPLEPPLTRMKEELGEAVIVCSGALIVDAEI